MLTCVSTKLATGLQRCCCKASTQGADLPPDGPASTAPWGPFQANRRPGQRSASPSPEALRPPTIPGSTGPQGTESLPGFPCGQNPFESLGSYQIDSGRAGRFKTSLSLGGCLRAPLGLADVAQCLGLSSLTQRRRSGFRRDVSCLLPRRRGICLSRALVAPALPKRSHPGVCIPR